MIIDCISDMHGSFPEVQGGDLLILAGDHLINHSVQATINFRNWLEKVAPLYRKVVLIGGNHDKWLEESDDFFKTWWDGEEFNVVYLRDSETEILTTAPGLDMKFLKIYGSPWTKWFEGINPLCAHFTKKTEEELKEKWDLIPEDVDILITHSPPYGILDVTRPTSKRGLGSQGSVWLMPFKFPKLKLHVFGHIHESYGVSEPEGDAPIFVNAAHMNRDYEPLNPPIRITL